MKFRKKPVEIEAFQLTEETRASNENWPQWAHEAWNKPEYEPGALFPCGTEGAEGQDELMIFTLEGLHRVSFGDWIIRGIKGELYPCKSDIFEATYDPVR